MNDNSKGNPLALLPLVVFLSIFIGSGIITGNFKSVPIIVAVLIAAGAALVMNRKKPFSEKMDVFCKGAGHPNIMLMAVIFILAGAFSATANGMGAVESTVNLALTILPHNLLIVGIFFIACFISLSMGTSTGTVVALAPIGIGISAQTDVSIALAMGAVIGGAMFGDNLSFISDTTIAAVRTQQTKMKDKFKVNFFIVLPAAIVTAVILFVLTSGVEGTVDTHSYNFVKILPYLAVLVAALAGANVLVVLAGGILLSGIIGFIDGSYTLLTFLQAVGEGIGSMQNLAMLAILIGGMVEIIKYNGGLDFLLHTVTKNVKSKRGAQFGIAGLVGLTNVSTANNTVSIIIAGPLAKNIADEYEVDPRKSASILDIFACTVQGMIPYGGQLMAASGLAAISPVAIMPYSFYPVLTGICGVLAIVFNWPKLASKQHASAKKNVS
ncbi:Na+/H+ antiporter NhaC family protein [Bacillus aerolatus]|uniref:Na+/H+ antiporter NhaC family protein n=1 Tax=Bacillus aerolatus TaxID=2653354 RepID=A0A6I1FQ65_9BACI|nr:Na+/H+ antiporter NhaC family protein [Bacillus aerolatus]KAB7706520.1 Na+/H+ antiporter NhaC family protein [Bacillus aerolatus]